MSDITEEVTENTTDFDIKPITIEKEMETSYLDYAMSVIVSRALPDVRDGLKPVHRRILYAMGESNYVHNKPHKKCARVVGDVMGKYHPHGDAAIYDTLVRMAQSFSMSLPLLDGQGNFGSMDGDKAAAMRYTEVRLAKSSTILLDDIEKNTVFFQPNYDGSVHEPVVLPAQYPNILVNGAGGIAVGMATNIAPHNLGEVLNACLAFIENPEMTIEELMVHIPGPDLPTGGTILGLSGIHSAYTTGRGSILMRSKTHTEELKSGKRAIVVTETPYQVNKARMVEKIAEVVKSKLVEGISDLRDESDRDGVRVVIELKRDADAEVVLNQLLKHTPLQVYFGINMLAIKDGRPQQLNLLEIIQSFIEFREEVITKRTLFDLNKARARAHILSGLAVAVANIDEMIALIRNAKDPLIAREQMMNRTWNASEVESVIRIIETAGTGLVDGQYRLSETQAKAILELKLHRLTGLERGKIAGELKEVSEIVIDLLDILNSKTRLFGMMRDDFIRIKEEFAVERRTVLKEGEFETNIEDLIQREDMVVTVTHNGYIKRVPLSTYNAQRRGGKGRSGMSTRDEDFLDQIFVANTHTPILFFTSKGMVHQKKVYRLPEGSPQSLGRALVNILPIAEDEKISAIMPMPENEEEWGELSVMFATSHGGARRNRLSDFTKIRSNGKIAMKFAEGSDETLIGVVPCDEDMDIMLATRRGKCIRFPVTKVRVFNSRNSTGVRGIRLAEGDNVVSMNKLPHSDATAEERDNFLRWRKGNMSVAETGLSEETLVDMQEKEEILLTVTENGYGKRSSSYEYRVTNRGGTGIGNIVMSERNGLVLRSLPIEDTDQIMLVTDSGKLIRCPVKNISITGRTTQGVTIFKVADGEKVVSIARVMHDENEDEDLDAEGEDSEGEGSEGVDATADTDAGTEAVETTTAETPDLDADAPTEE
ncbi:MAG: DNA gyrase subunit A [Alphaproteobacteria bacterium]